MVKLNTAAAIREQHAKTYKFNRYINRNNRKTGRKWRRHPLNMDLTGFEAWFKLWLSAFYKIDDFDLHLENIEKNHNPKKLYFQRSTGRYKIINR